MKMEIGRYSIKIIPETKVDIAYIEEVLSLKNGGDSIPATRLNAMGLASIAYIEIALEEVKDDTK